MKKDIKIGEGNETEAYKIDNDVVKFYKAYCQKLRLTKKVCDALSKIDTKRILLPCNTLLDKKHKIKGYTMKYIDNLGEDSFYKLSRKDLSKEMSLVENDLIKLSDNGVLINDLHQGNTIYNNGIYLIDPGSYKMSEEDKKESIKTYGINLDMINEYLINEVIKNCALKICKKDVQAFAVTKKLQNDIYSKSENPLYYFMEDMQYKDIEELVIDLSESLKFSVSINRKKINLNKKEISKLYKTDDKEIYSYKDNDEDKLLYVYKTSRTPLKLKQKDLDKLKDIDTKRFLLPIDNVNVSKEEYLGFTILQKKDYEYLFNEIDGKTLNKELSLLKEDVLLLSENGFYIGDIDRDSMIYDGAIYIKNVEEIENSSDENLIDKNMDKLNQFIINDIIKEELYEFASSKDISKVLSFLNSSNDYFIGDTIKNEIEESENLKGCVKKLIINRGK